MISSCLAIGALVVGQTISTPETESASADWSPGGADEVGQIIQHDSLQRMRHVYRIADGNTLATQLRHKAFLVISREVAIAHVIEPKGLPIDGDWIVTKAVSFQSASATVFGAMETAAGDLVISGPSVFKERTAVVSSVIVNVTKIPRCVYAQATSLHGHRRNKEQMGSDTIN